VVHVAPAEPEPLGPKKRPSTLYLLQDAPLLPATPAQAQGESNAVCGMVWKTYLSPGFTMAKATGKYGTGVGITGAETGLITCSGTINGHRVTGPGTFGRW
jgi:hypothetical protein